MNHDKTAPNCLGVSIEFSFMPSSTPPTFFVPSIAYELSISPRATPDKPPVEVTDVEAFDTEFEKKEASPPDVDGVTGSGT